MTKLLINLLIFSLGFAVVAARHHEKITFQLALRVALTGVFLLGMAAVLGFVIAHQTLEKTFLVLDNSNDMHMGVIYGAAAIYISVMCCLWSLSRHFQHRRVKSKK